MDGTTTGYGSRYSTDPHGPYPSVRTTSAGRPAGICWAGDRISSGAGRHAKHTNRQKDHGDFTLLP